MAARKRFALVIAPLAALPKLEWNNISITIYFVHLFLVVVVVVVAFVVADVVVELFSHGFSFWTLLQLLIFLLFYYYETT